jgi:cytochrome c oxidase cbb3-type subunit III
MLARKLFSLSLVMIALALPWLVTSAQEPGAGPGGRRMNIREFLGLGPAPNPELAKKGEPLYAQNCAGCHGKDARGAQAPGLVRMAMVISDYKGENMISVLKEGKGGMPAFPQLSKDDVMNLSQWLQLQVELAANRGTYGGTYGNLRNQVTGDPKKGEAFFAANCASCHSVTGDLAKIGMKFPQVATLKNRFLWPAAQGPAMVKVTTADGKVIAGRAKTNTDFEISLTDAQGNYHAFARNSVKVEIEDKLTGHRALLPKYSDADINNITAYLVTIK